MISASATGFYGNRELEVLTEESVRGEGFLADVCEAWEQEARRATELGVRVVLLRTGIVLDQEGGALAKMLLPFKLGLGSPLGNGKQYMSWIHIEDEVRLIAFALQMDEISGPLNATSPNPVSNREFTSELCRVLHRPRMPSLPGAAIRLGLGEMGKALLLNGQRVLPEKALNAGYAFRFPELGAALEDLLA
jgi:uncharacterized protein (TIGR01777 family)